jgi:branched-subunit amino acid transport protein
MTRIILSILIMALTTYLLRALPLTLFTKQIRNRFVRSFLAYVPYAVLAAMTIPGILSSTGDIRTAAAGLVVAVVMAWRGCSLLTVAIGACIAVAAAQGILLLL